MKATFTLFFLLFLITTVSAQKNSTGKSATDDKTLYVFCQSIVSNKYSYETWMLFEPFPIESKMAINIGFLGGRGKSWSENYFKGTREIFDQHYAIDKFNNLKNSKDYEYCYKFSTLDSAKVRFNDEFIRHSEGYQKNIDLTMYIVDWQPSAKYTGIEPTQPTPKVRDARTGSTVAWSQPVTAKPTDPSPSKPTRSAGITVEKKDTSFEEADSKRILQEKKAAAQRSAQKAAQKAPQISPTQRKMIKLKGSSRQ